MRAHPVMLRLDGRRCVVMGGDRAAEAKVEACLWAGAAVAVIAPDVTPRLSTLAAEGAIQHLARDYRPGDLAGAFVAYASTADPELVHRLREEADRERVLLNVVDRPEACTFIAPAVVRRGELTVAVGTGGASPGLAARLRGELEQRFGPEYEPFVAILGAVRRALGDVSARPEVMAALIDSPLLELVRRGERAEVDRLLARVAGDGCTLDRLGVALDERGF